jgi:GT2 family glycosyltransferase
MPRALTVYLSVLNWNKAATTLGCVEQLLGLEIPPGVSTRIFVVDNGSRADDWEALSQGLRDRAIVLTRQETNLGFAGGHNLILSKAMEDGADYVWLVNNDGRPAPDALAQLIAVAESDPSCGAVSPLITALDDWSRVEFCGGYHDWGRLATVTFDFGRDGDAFERADPRSTWLSGAAFMLRTQAVREVGPLDPDYFAYSEDNDLCARLATAGWRNRIAFGARFQHETPDSRHPYFYYLMARNSFFFWTRHTPKGQRRLLRLRLIDKGLFASALRLSRGLRDGADATLLGISDGLLGRGGPPRLGRRPPWPLRMLRGALWPYHRRHIRDSQPDLDWREKLRDSEARPD